MSLSIEQRQLGVDLEHKIKDKEKPKELFIFEREQMGIEKEDKAAQIRKQQ